MWNHVETEPPIELGCSLCPGDGSGFWLLLTLMSQLHNSTVLVAEMKTLPRSSRIHTAAPPLTECPGNLCLRRLNRIQLTSQEFDCVYEIIWCQEHFPRWACFGSKRRPSSQRRGATHREDPPQLKGHFCKFRKPEIHQHDAARAQRRPTSSGVSLGHFPRLSPPSGGSRSVLPVLGAALRFVSCPLKTRFSRGKSVFCCRCETGALETKVPLLGVNNFTVKHGLWLASGGHQSPVESPPLSQGMWRLYQPLWLAEAFLRPNEVLLLFYFYFI